MSSGGNQWRRPQRRNLLGLIIVIAAGLWFAFGSLTGPKKFGELTATDRDRYPEFEQLAVAHRVGIADEDEPGERLNLCLTFVDRETGVALKQESVKFYHTTTAGDYEPVDPGDESTARLSGWGVTDSFGRILVKTILPGDYGSSSDNRHIHIHVTSAVPQAYDIYFLQYSTFMMRRFSRQSHQHFLADLKKTENGDMVTFLTIECKIPN